MLNKPDRLCGPIYLYMFINLRKHSKLRVGMMDDACMMDDGYMMDG